MGDQCVHRTESGPLAVITIDHPPLNLFDEQLTTGFAELVTGLAVDTPRAALIRASGKVVSAGVDVNRFAGRSNAEGTAQMAELMRITHAVEALDFPVVFAAHGLTLTAAFELALASDILLAAESARFGLVESTVGLSPGMGGTQRLARTAGPARARELVMTGDIYDAACLAGWGVVNRVLPDDGFRQAAEDFAQRLAQGPTLAHAVTKRVVRAYEENGVPAADRIAPEAVGGLYETADFQGGVHSLLENGPGKAEFEGQ